MRKVGIILNKGSGWCSAIFMVAEIASSEAIFDYLLIFCPLVIVLIEVLNDTF